MNVPATLESRTLAVSIAREAEAVYRFVSNPANLPQWATAFCQSIRQARCYENVGANLGNNFDSFSLNDPGHCHAGRASGAPDGAGERLPPGVERWARRRRATRDES